MESLVDNDNLPSIELNQVSLKTCCLNKDEKYVLKKLSRLLYTDIDALNLELISNTDYAELEKKGLISLRFKRRLLDLVERINSQLKDVAFSGSDKIWLIDNKPTIFRFIGEVRPNDIPCILARDIKEFIENLPKNKRDIFIGRNSIGENTVRTTDLATLANLTPIRITQIEGELRSELRSSLSISILQIRDFLNGKIKGFSDLEAEQSICSHLNELGVAGLSFKKLSQGICKA